MAESWEQLVAATGLPVEGLGKLWAALPGDDESRAATLRRLLLGIQSDWPTVELGDDSLAAGIYSPIQFLLWRSAQKTHSRIDFEYPFLFSTIGELMAAVLVPDADAIPNPDPKEHVPPASADFRRLLQSLFVLREMREEGEALSLEVQIPFSKGERTPMGIRKLAQVFGRGVGISRQESLAVIQAPEGSVVTVFREHDNAPLSLLYGLEAPFSHVAIDELTVVLRRDGHLTVASHRNPLLEFYDGGWRTVDLQSGRAALNQLLDGAFEGEDLPTNLGDNLVGLAYHLATHGHGAILAVVGDDWEKLLEPQAPESKRMSDAVTEAMRLAGDSAKLTDVDSSGMGRLFLSCAMQDGAVLFDRRGELLSAGRIVRQSSGVAISGGARRHASKSLAISGVVVSVSQDGAIRLFSGKPGGGAPFDQGLRIH